MLRSAAYALPLVDVVRREGLPGEGDRLTFETVHGDIPGRYHSVTGGATRAVIWLPGAAGGLSGPAGLWPDLALRLLGEGIESLRLDWRRPSRREEGVRDALLGVRWLQGERGIERVALVGHGHGAAVALATAELRDDVVAVAALALPIAEGGVIGLDRPLLLVAPEGRPSPREEQVDVLAYGEGDPLTTARDRIVVDLAAWLARVL